jgi:histone H3/H4
MNASSQTIYVTIRQVYGQTMLYPACERAHAICELTGRKTITSGDIKSLSKLGIQVKEGTESVITRRNAALGLAA